MIPAMPLRARVEMQGFLGLSDDALDRIEPWLRFSPAISAGWAATATWEGSAVSLSLLAVMALIGVVLPSHPFDAVYNHGIRRLTATPPIPRQGAPRRFACASAAVWLGATAALFASGATAAGRMLGGAFTLVALAPALTGFCVPSYVHGLVGRRAVTRPGGGG